MNLKQSCVQQYKCRDGANLLMAEIVVIMQIGHMPKTPLVGDQGREASMNIGPTLPLWVSQSNDLPQLPP